MRDAEATLNVGNALVNRSSFDKILLASQNIFLAIFAALFLLKAYTSLNWRMEHDTPILHYAAFLMNQYGLIPYRDILDTSMPGAFAFHYFIIKLFGYGDFAFRCVDLALLGALLVATYVFMRRFGRLVAVWAAVLFGLLYLSMGQEMSLQRDYVGIIPIAFALLCIPAKMDEPVQLVRFALVGLLFGMSVLIKPHLGIALPIVFGTLLVFRWHSRKKSMPDFVRCAAITGAATLIPVIIALAWLAANSALAPFINILFNVIPLYSSIMGGSIVLSGFARISYLIGATSKFGGFGAFFLSSLFAYYHVVMHADEDKASIISLKCLCFCTLAYAIYPALAGKFFQYHYMPFAYFCSISTGLCLFAWFRRNSHLAHRAKQTLLLTALLIAVTLQLPLYEYVYTLDSDFRSGSKTHAPKKGRVDEIAGWLKGRLRPGDTVQPLDITGGSIQGMLLAEARLATSFLTDYNFYHHVSSPIVQELRQSFIEQLHKASPRFIIDVFTADKPFGKDTTREFPELRQFINDHYTAAYIGEGYRIYQRMDEVQPSEEQP